MSLFANVENDVHCFAFLNDLQLILCTQAAFDQTFPYFHSLDVKQVVPSVVLTQLHHISDYIAFEDSKEDSFLIYFSHLGKQLNSSEPQHSEGLVLVPSKG